MCIHIVLGSNLLSDIKCVSRNSEMNVDDSGFDSDTKFGGDKTLKKFALQNSESWGLKALEDSSELFPPADGVNGDIESSEHSLQTFPEVSQVYKMIMNLMLSC